MRLFLTQEFLIHESKHWHKLKRETDKLTILSHKLSNIPLSVIDMVGRMLKDPLNNGETMPGTGNVANQSLLVKSWILEDKLQPLSY